MPQAPESDDEFNESLGDYLGHLLSSVTKARMQADLETIRIAEQYQSHPLLKHFPVPRVRLPKVELNVPVIMVGTLTPDGLESRDDDDTDDNLSPQQQLATQVLDVFSELLEELGGHGLSPAIKAKIQPELQAIVEKVYGDPGSAKATLRRTRADKDISDRLTKIPRIKNSLSTFTDKTTTVAKYLVNHFYRIRFVRTQINQQKLDSKVQASLRQSFLSEVNQLLLNQKHKAASKIVIQAQTSKVRESSHEHLAMFKLTVTEDSVEWTVNEPESEQDPDEILVPE
ncbi:hypothetical protein [Pseudobacteriovorax antillogorgiicola]|uniref:Uncharacterized protein n=1 Tax=Pseudobacteriovorax antillogorgiicola TaxID=1513793 RepID=A0A1Y6BMG0_9BACT|nr:hypothetical protein [Pseudobacteriovorax antillogorgiicola]TCS54631.1 hypothetical protein EDD56_106144 [Pseudobacteriovorax antillogorgiicola]SMF17174.1 hypothetical protein SAMN06296036_10699 [Pseudobacteriovorax antillogorgiicola]